MPVNQQYNLFGKKVSQTYHNLLQSGSDGKYYDGDGNEISIISSNGVTQITAGTGVIISPSSGVGNVTINATAATYNTATGSYGSFFSTGSQTAVLATEIYSMSISTTDISNGVYISGSGDPYNTFVKFTNTGTYNVQFSAQFSNSGNNPSDVFIWLRKNDVSSVNDLADSTGVCTVPAKKGSTNGQLIASWNYLINVVAGDFIQLLWHTADANVITLETINSGSNPTHPRTPALILTAQRVDTFLSNTGSFSGSFTGEFTGSLNGTANNALNADNANALGGIDAARYAQLEGDPITFNNEVTFTNPINGNLNGTASNASAITVYNYASDFESYILLSNAIGQPSVAVGGDDDLRYNTLTNKLTVGSISVTNLTGSSFTGSFTGSFNGVVLTSQTSSMLAPYVLNSQTSSFVQNNQTSSFITNSQTGSFTRLATGSVTASVTPTQFLVTSGSSTELTVTGTGVTIGNVITDIHRITGSLNISGSLTAVSFTGSLSGSSISSSYALTASYALTSAGGGGGSGFPFSGSAVITGSLLVSGSGITITGSLNMSGPIIYPILTQTSNYTLQLSDAGDIVEINSASANTVTIPTSSTTNFTIGTQITLVQYGAGQTTVTTGSTNVLLRSAGNATKIAAQYGAATIIKRGTDEWYLLGNITV